AELGGIFIPRTHNIRIVLHAGVTLPTATNGSDASINRLATAARITDSYLALPRATSLRFGASPMWRSGQVVFRIDLGFDANLDIDNRAQANSTLRFDGALGVDLGTAMIGFEVANAFVSGNGGGW